MNKEALAAVNERRQTDPILCLLMWATALNGDAPREIYQALGVYHDELFALFGGHEQEMAKMRQLRMVAEMFNREFLAKLLRARLGELLMQCSKATDFAALMRAVKIMPEWVMDEQPARDMRTEDPRFDDVMKQPLQDEDGEHSAPDFATLASAGPLLAERIYEQLREQLAPNEMADGDDADVADPVGAKPCFAQQGGDADADDNEADVDADTDPTEAEAATAVPPDCSASSRSRRRAGSNTDADVAVGAHGCAPQQPGS